MRRPFRRLPLAGLALAAALAAAPAGAANTEIGRACDSPEHCLPQNQLRYYELLRQAIGQHWTPPSSAAADSVCTLELNQSPGGAVTSVRAIEPCGLDAAGRDTLLAAVRAASPLPYQGYQQVFKPRLRLAVHVPEPDEREGRVKRWWRQVRER
ncbi:hypothetical protein J5226_10030 [Lysobacter sp. K5869]|uniref:TonB C-terminal domain-containing protein n=1 Tax=Lysobacter sp. K5869 TaxID=2820808 RepID=UPI001C061F05|nr:TonB C-terminal domain-containing protein [Lysobacter sp. K5869]QWP78702.1 hypothetical protein J5226_10030 [Lysobacter sp. K5869]